MSGRPMMPARLRHSAVRVLVILLVIATVSPALPATRPASAAAGRPSGTVPEQPGGTAEGRSHRASTEDTGGTAKKPERPQEPSRQPAQARPQQPRTEVKTGAQPAVAAESFDPRFSQEIVGERDARTSVYANPDGTKTAQISAQPEFYRTSDGKWEKIDSTLVDDGGVVRNKAGAIGHRFAKKADSKALGEYRVRDGVSVGFGVTGAAPVAGSRDGDLINYADVRAQSDVELQSTTTGIKETIVLKSKDAPTEWDFPLELKGLTASLDDKGAVRFKDGSGAVKAQIPHGFMEDSAFPQAGTGAYSAGVTYSLNQRDGKTVLHVSIDKAWVTDPARVFPIKVDPSVEDQQVDTSTFVQTGFVTSQQSMAELRAGTWDGGANKAATYLNFGGVSSRFAGQYVLGAQLYLANIHSFSCSPRNVNVYQVTQPWSANGIAGFPGPGYGALVGSSNFSYAYSYPGSTCPDPQWAAITLNQAGTDLVNSWVHGAANYGLTVRTSETDSYAWKKFASRNSGNPPFLRVTYSPYWATYQLPQGMSTPISSTQDGVMPVTVTNWGKDVWTSSNNYQLTYHLYDASGVEMSQASTYHVAMPYNVGYGQSATINMPIKKLPPGNWTIRFDMDKYGTTMFGWQGVPTSGTVAITIGDQYPIIDAMSPSTGDAVDTLTPALSFQGHDPDNYPYHGTAGRFWVSDESDVQVADSNWVGDGQSTGFSGAVSWQVPAGVLKWGKTYKWSASIGSWGNNGPVVSAGTFTTAVRQPALLSHAGAAAIEAGRGFDPATRNYTTEATDAVVKTVGPDLSVVRTYNSVDTRLNLAFGAGWSSRYDAGVELEGDGNVVVTYPDGQQVRFGKNPDGTYAAPLGRFATLTAQAGGWKLIDKSAMSYVFNSAGKLTSLTDGFGRAVTLTYDQGKLVSATNAQGGRSLRFQWTGNHVTSVSTDPTGGADSELTWRYTYDRDQLTKACDPTNACTTYEYHPGSAYQTYVLDTAEDYLPLNDAGSGSFAANLVPERPGAKYTNVTSSTDNPFGSDSSNTAVFNGTSSVVSGTGDAISFSPPDGAPSRVSAWFKTTTAGGVLIGNSTGSFGVADPVTVFPVVYIGADGKLRDSSGTASPSLVIDGKWHHVDLVLRRDSGGPKSELVLDGAVVGESDNSFTVNVAAKFTIGAGPLKSTWPAAAPTGAWSYFQGKIGHFSIDDYSWDKSPYFAILLWRLRSITDPSGRRTSEVTYDVEGAGQAEKVVDRNGGTWYIHHPWTNDGSAWRKPQQQVYYNENLQYADSGWFADWSEPSTTRGLVPITDFGALNITQPGPFGEPAAVFPSESADGVPGSYLSGARTKSVELWFKTSTTKGGVLLGSGRDYSWADQPPEVVPVLYVGPDGKLRGRFRNGQLAAITTANSVNDGNWHHVVLAASSTGQALYLDGAVVGTQAGPILSDYAGVYIGHGLAGDADWPGKPTLEDGQFEGALTHLAFYRRALTPAQVGAHYAARTSQDAYKSVVRTDVPQGFFSFGAGKPVQDPQIGHATFTDVQLDTKVMTLYGGTSGTFNGTSSTAKLPDWQLHGRYELSTDLWFNTTSSAGGVLLGTADRAIGDGTPQAGHAVLYIGTDGRLRGRYGSADGEPLSTVEKVNDGQWHHVALTGLGTSQVLYLDGKVVGHLNGTYADDERFVYVGAGWLGTDTHPERPADEWGKFNGTISNLAFHAWALTGPNVEWRFHTGRSDRHEVSVVDPADKEVRYGLDHDHGDRLSYKSDANDGMEYYEYDKRGFLANVTDGNGNSTTTGHDDRGNLVSQSTCRSRTQCNTAYYSYYLNPADPADPRNDLLLTSRDARSASKDDTSFLTTYAYTAHGDLESVRGPSTAAAPEGAVTTNQYTAGTEAVPSFAGAGTQPPGLLKSTTDAAGGVTSFAYNRFGDLVETVDPAGKATRYAHDGIGRPVSETVLSSALPGGSVTSTTTYDGASRPLTTTGPATTDAVSGTAHQLRVKNTHNPDGTLASRSLEDVAGNDASRTTSYTYDDRGRVATVKDPEDGVTGYSYDLFGNVTKTVDALGHETVFTYTPTNQHATTVVKGFNGDGQPARDVTFESRAYDPAGRLASVTDAMGRTTAYKYFDDGLVSSTVRTGFRNADGSRRDITLSSHVYDGVGNEIRTEKAGVVTERTFDAAGNQVRVVGDPAGAARSTAIAYNVLGNPITATRTDGAGTGTEVVEFGYDALGRPVRQAVRNGAETLATTTVRDQSGLQVSATDPRGNAPGATASQFTTDFAVDAYGRVVTATAPPVSVESGGTVRPVTTTGYNTFGEAVSVKDPNGKVTTSAYDKAGRPTAVTRPAYTAPGGTAVNSVSTTAYDKLGRPTSSTDAAGGVTGYEYDVLGNLTKRTDPVVGTDAAGVSTFRYTPLGEPLGATGATGAVVSSTFDDLGREVTSTVQERFPAPGRNLTTTTTYNDSGTVASVKAPDNAVTMYAYNGLGEVTSTKDPSGKTSSVVRDFAGRVTRATDPLGLKVDTVFDPAGRATGTTWRDAAGQALRSTSAGYDAAGNTTALTDPLGATTTRQWNALNLLVSETEPVTASASVTIGFGYDAAGNQTRRTDGNGNITTTTFNSWNLPESVVEPSTAKHPAAADRTWTTSYDAMARPIRFTQPGNVVRQRTYDAMGNFTKETGSGTAVSTPDRVLGYDRAGRLTSAGANAYTYDDRGNLLSMAGPSGTGSYTYDDASRLVQRVDAAGTTAYTYDPVGRLKTALDPRTGATATFTRDDAGRATSVGYGTGNGTRAYTYDDLNRVVTDTVKNPAGQATASIAYGYDTADRLTSKTTTGLAAAASNTYGYDKANRLTSWNDGTNQVAYTWDNNGNRLTAGAVTATYDQRNRLLTSGSTTYDYTARGTLQSTTTGGTTVNQGFDAFDRLVTDGSATYTYDALDRRVGAGFSYSDLGNNLATDGTGTYSRLPGGELLGLTQGGSSALTYTDRHTDLVGTFTASGAVSSSVSYTPNGEVIGRTGATHALGYESGWTDSSTGRVNRAARWYTPGTGTFTSRDDISGPGGPGHSAYNRYLYGTGNPLNMTDPTGHFGWGSMVSTLTKVSRVAAMVSTLVAVAPLMPAALAITVGITVGIAAFMYLGAGTANAPTRPNPKTGDKPGGTQESTCRPGTPGCGGQDNGCTGPSCGFTPPGTTPTTNDGRRGPCSVTPCPVPPAGPSKEELDQIAAAAKVLTNALTPIAKPPSGATLAPEIRRLVDDASRVVTTVVGGQTVAQRIPEPAPGEADDPRLPPTGTQNGGQRCRENWQLYDDMEEDVTWNGVTGDRATGAMACVVSTRKTTRPKLGFKIFGLDTGNRIVRCHLIGHKLNGSNTDPANFVPCHQDPTNNGWMYKKVEAKIAAQVDAGNPVLMGVKPVYTTNNPVPDLIVVNAIGENGWTCQAYIPNMNKAGAAFSGIPFTGC